MSNATGYIYARPQSLAELKEILLDASGKNISFLAGGTDLWVDVEKAKKIPEAVIDLKSIQELNIFEVAKEAITVSALTTIHDLAESPLIKANWQALAESAAVLGSLQVRNRATLGGNLCNGAPTADTAAPLLALDAVIHIWGPKGERSVKASEFWLGPAKTCLARQEIVKSVTFPYLKNQSSKFLKHGPRKAMDIAIVSVAAAMTIEDGIIRDARIAAGGAASKPIRFEAAEKCLVGQAIREADFSAAAAQVREASDPRSSSRASREHRLAILPVLTERALKEIAAKPQ